MFLPGALGYSLPCDENETAECVLPAGVALWRWDGPRLALPA